MVVLNLHQPLLLTEILLACLQLRLTDFVSVPALLGSHSSVADLLGQESAFRLRACSAEIGWRKACLRCWPTRIACCSPHGETTQGSLRCNRYSRAEPYHGCIPVLALPCSFNVSNGMAADCYWVKG